jgi:hypothetical protein
LNGRGAEGSLWIFIEKRKKLLAKGVNIVAIKRIMGGIKLRKMFLTIFYETRGHLIFLPNRQCQGNYERLFVSYSNILTEIDENSKNFPENFCLIFPSRKFKKGIFGSVAYMYRYTFGRVVLSLCLMTNSYINWMHLHFL